MANEWTILGKDLISEVTCKEPYEWKDLTGEEWEFSKAAQAQAAEKPFHVAYLSSLNSTEYSKTFHKAITLSLDLSRATNEFVLILQLTIYV